VTLTVEEAANTYIRAMRPVEPVRPGICSVCHTFCNPDFSRCFQCAQDDGPLDVVAPITYSEHLSQMHTVLRGYKDGNDAAQRGFMGVRLAAILWKFLEQHESCIARAAGLAGPRFDLVTTVPSSTTERDEVRGNLRLIVGEVCEHTAGRYQRLLRPADGGLTGRAFDRGRYQATEDLSERTILVVDDTWARGGHAQSAGGALKDAGAARVATVVIGRHVSPTWEPVQGSGETCGDMLKELPHFSWDSCCVHL
jgi:predicted amidophosphoribosyltransferase